MQSPKISCHAVHLAVTVSISGSASTAEKKKKTKQIQKI